MLWIASYSLSNQFNSNQFSMYYSHDPFDSTLPNYLSKCLKSRECAREVRSNAIKRLDPPKKPKLKNVGGRTFGQIAPKVWNSLPSDLRAVDSLPHFKRKLKTHFFKIHFGWDWHWTWRLSVVMLKMVVLGDCCCLCCKLIVLLCVSAQWVFYLIWFCAI